MKRIIIILTLLCSFSLFYAQETGDYNRENVLKFIQNAVPTAADYYLQAGQGQESIAELSNLSEFLIADNFKLFLNQTPTTYKIIIEASPFVTTNEKTGFFSKKYFAEQNILIRIIDPAGQILAQRTFLRKEETDNSEKARWYDPLMITAVLGGMIYLFYFGNN